MERKKSLSALAFNREKKEIDLKDTITFEKVNINNIKNETFTLPLNVLVAGYWS